MRALLLTLIFCGYHFRPGQAGCYTTLNCSASDTEDLCCDSRFCCRKLEDSNSDPCWGECTYGDNCCSEGYCCEEMQDDSYSNWRYFFMYPFNFLLIVVAISCCIRRHRQPYPYDLPPQTTVYMGGAMPPTPGLVNGQPPTVVRMAESHQGPPPAYSSPLAAPAQEK